MHKLQAVAVAATLLLSGCAWNEDAILPTFSAEKIDVWPDFSGDKKPQPAGQAATPGVPGVAGFDPSQSPGAVAPPLLGTTNFTPMLASPGSPTGTAVGGRVAQLRGELQTMNDRVNQHNTRLQQVRSATAGNAQRYHGTVAAVTARLQLGTTPSNPVVISQWNAAQADLDRLSSDIAALNSLSNAVANDAGVAEFLLESARATYGLGGAIDEDHRQLGILEDETNRSQVLVQRLLSELDEDISRQTGYVANERARLTALANGVKQGQMYGEPLSSIGAPTMPGYASGGPAINRGRVGVRLAGNTAPLVVIRFDRADVEYEQPLYTALSRTLERRPDARFDVVSVAPSSGNASDLRRSQNASRRNAEAVMSAITDMGLPANRITLSSTTSADVVANEVHIFVR